MSEDKKPDIRSNVEFVTEIMEFHSSGPVAQLFVIEALRVYCAYIAAQDIHKIRAKDEANPQVMISAEQWWAVGVDIQKELDKKYEHNLLPGALRPAQKSKLDLVKKPPARKYDH